MAAEVKRKSKYATYGSVAYAPGYDGSAVRQPAPEELVRPRPRVRPKDAVRARPKVQVRERGHVSLFAVVGFLAIGMMAVLVLASYVQLTVINDNTIHLTTELSSLQSENIKLLAEYELAYDLKSVEEIMDTTGAMVRPQSSQIGILDMSEADSVELFNAEKSVDGVGGLLAGAQDIVNTVLAYFP